MPQKTGLYQFFPTVAFPPPQRLQGKGNPSSPRTRRSMWPILPATSHLRLRSGGFFTPPGGHVRQRFPDRTQSRQTRMKVLLVVELLILLILVVYGWGPDFQTWARRRKRHSRRGLGVGAGVPLLVPSLRVASPGQRAASGPVRASTGPVGTSTRAVGRSSVEQRGPRRLRSLHDGWRHFPR